MIFLACILTVAIETPFFMLFGFRKKDDITIVVCTNVLTNIILNLLLMLVFKNTQIWVYFLEALVVLCEYGIYAAAFGRSAKLFLLTLAANVLSYTIGLLLF